MAKLEFTISKQFNEAFKPEEVIVAFLKENDARAYLQQIVQQAQTTRVKATFRLYQDEERLEEIDAASDKINLLAEPEERETRRSSSTTPFSTRPKPVGGKVTDYLNDEDDL